MLLFYQVLHLLLLFTVLKGNLESHFRSVDGDDLFEFFNEFQSLLLGIMLGVDLHVGFGHGFHYDAYWELLPICCVHAFLSYDVSNFLFEIVKLIVSLQFRNLEFTLVKNLNDYLFIREFSEN